MHDEKMITCFIIDGCCIHFHRLWHCQRCCHCHTIPRKRIWTNLRIKSRRYHVHRFFLTWLSILQNLHLTLMALFPMKTQTNFWLSMSLYRTHLTTHNHSPCLMLILNWAGMVQIKIWPYSQKMHSQTINYP